MCTIIGVYKLHIKNAVSDICTIHHIKIINNCKPFTMSWLSIITVAT